MTFPVAASGWGVAGKKRNQCDKGRSTSLDLCRPTRSGNQRLKFHVAHLESLWQNFWSLVLTADAAVDHSDSLSGSTTLTAPNTQNAACSWLMGSPLPKHYLGQTSCLIQSHPPLEGSLHPVTSQWLGTKACPRYNSGLLGKANLLNHMQAKLHPRVCFMKNPTRFPEARDVIQDSPIFSTFPKILMCNSGYRSLALANLLPFPPLKEVEWC